MHWLELFFDLVMVAYIGQIAHTMHGDPGWLQAGAFFALLAAAWWAWVNASLTMNLFGARVTPMIWVSVTLAMIAIGVMAAAVPEAFGERAAAFAIGNALIRMVWAVPWIVKRRQTGTPWWRPLLYSVLPAGLWLVSAWVPAPVQYLLWGLAIAIEVVLLVTVGSQSTWLRRQLDVEHIVERVFLLVVIVFGESILSIIAELDSHWAILPGTVAALGFVAVSMLAWTFFGYAPEAVTRGIRRLQSAGSISGLRDIVMYLPFLIVAGVTLFAAGLGTAVADAGHELPDGAAVCMAAGVSLFFASSMGVSLRYGAPWRHIALWGPAGIVLPWALVPVSKVVPAEGVVIAAVAIVAALLVLTDVNARRLRVLIAAASE